jgi:microcystin degradation protein MlrC
MRIPVLGISHETNTFSRVPADYDQFVKSGILRGHEIFDKFGESLYTIAGYLEASHAFGFELVPLMYAQTGPIGTITRDAYNRLTEEMFGMLREQGPWDAVLISNHGAAVSEEFPDMDGAFTQTVREIVGPDIPVGITLDMHANVSKAVVANTDVCVVWRTNPHLDPKPRGRKCAELVYRAAKGEIKPVQWIEMPPLVVNIVRQFTGEEPMKSLVADCLEANGRPKILDTSVAEGYPYADVEEMGMSWVAIADGDPAAAREAAAWMAQRAWPKREALNTPVPGIREALEMAQRRYRGPRRLGEVDEIPSDGTALAAPESVETADGKAPRNGPIVLMDVGDNIGGGSSADSTFILSEAQKMGVKSLLQSLYDPESVAACVRAGVGAQVTLEVGGKTDDMHGTPQVGGHRPYPRRLQALLRGAVGAAGYGGRAHAGAYLEALRQHVTLPDVLGRDHPGALPDRGGKGSRLSAAGVSADRRRSNPCEHAGSNHCRSLVLHVPPPPRAAVSVRGRR